MIDEMFQVDEHQEARLVLGESRHLAPRVCTRALQVDAKSFGDGPGEPDFDDRRQPMFALTYIPTSWYVLGVSRAQAAKEKLLNAALSLIREKGFASTTVDDLCASAGVTKGAFFHYFKSKEQLGVAAAEHWSAVTSAVFERAPYHDPEDPLERVLAYIEFRRELLRGDISEFTCVVGTMVQETYEQHPEIRDACAACIFGHAGTITADIAKAMSQYGVVSDWTAESLAAHTQAVLQGAFILAKAKNDVGVAIESVTHLRRYVELLFAGSASGAVTRRSKSVPPRRMKTNREPERKPR